ncbi:putative type VI secretion system effector [Iodobacter sp. CM08]|uniref:putative type VI secretion system effector n=1 Tax=Iodobacter sp. CM08 TaxID=3085902 RepID=UPI00298285A6|nr:putative type VI secretion system effector [Iodobacter sp. CM08]MDW5419100.1 putative type VI secretion system effector [Iodobacter sp. CM08]
MNKTSNASEKPTGVIKISGQIKNYKETRARANFFFTENDQNVMGMAAIGAALVGNSGQAMGAAISASDMEEEADYLEFEIDNIKVKGWVWCSPFKNDDYVEVVGEWNNGCFELAAIARPDDRIIALYPHCSRGKKAHIRNAVNLWFSGVTAFLWLASFLVPFVFMFIESSIIISTLIMMIGLLITLFVYLFFGKKGLGVQSIVMLFILIGTLNFRSVLDVLAVYWPVPVFFYIFMGAFAINYSWKTMKFVTVATHVFKALGLENPSSVDLPKRSKMNPLPISPVAAKAPPSKSAIAKAAKDAAAAKALTPKAAAKKVAKDKANAEYAEYLAAHAAETEGPVKPSLSAAFGSMYFRY